MYQAPASPLLTTMHMITPGIAASLTPKSLERAETAASRTRPEAAGARARRHLHLPRVLLQLPHPHLPHRSA